MNESTSSRSEVVLFSPKSHCWMWTIFFLGTSESFFRHSRASHPVWSFWELLHIWFLFIYLFLFSIICPILKSCHAIHFQTNHHHPVAPSAWTSLSLSCHPSLSSIASSWSSKLHHYISTELLYVGFCWSTCLCLSMWRCPLKYVTYELVPTSPALSPMSGSFNLHSFRDWWEVTVQLLFCGLVPPVLVQYCSQHSCAVAVRQKASD